MKKKNTLLVLACIAALFAPLRISAAFSEAEKQLMSCFTNADYDALAKANPDFTNSIRYQINEYHKPDHKCFRVMNLAESSQGMITAELEADIKKRFEAKPVGLFEKAYYAKAKAAAGLPKPGMKNAALEQEIVGAVNYWLQDKDGGATVVIKKCVVTGKKWQNMSTDEGHSARMVNTACTLEIEKDFCVVLYDGCYQEYLGDKKYAACRYRSYNYQPAATIKCSKAK